MLFRHLSLSAASASLAERFRLCGRVARLGLGFQILGRRTGTDRDTHGFLPVASVPVGVCVQVGSGTLTARPMTMDPVGSASPTRVQILGMPVDVVTMDEALATIEAFLREDRTHLVITADASGIVQACEDPELRDLYHTADLVTPDGIGVVWAAKRKGVHLPNKVSGVDMVDQLCAASKEKGYRIYLLGAEPGVAELAGRRLSEKHPGCKIVGARHGYFRPPEDEAVAREVSETRPDILFVAMGIPRQEKFIRATQEIIRAKVAMGVGGSFDVYSGKVRRAPLPVRKMKLEWLWRLALNPSKISKVKLLPRFVRMVLKEKR